jgi:fibronectin type 3 domain-containing protein
MKQFFASALLALAGLVAHAQAPPVPTGASAVVQDGTMVAFTWNASPGATSYNVYSNGTLLGNDPNVGWLVTNPVAGASYTVAAVNASGTSAQSAPVTVGGVTPPPTPPITPTKFCATDPNPACGVALTWTAGASTPATAANPAPPAATGFLVFRGIQGGAVPTQITPTALPVTQTSYTDNTIAASTTYEYYVVSVDAAGAQSAPSNTESVVVAAAPSVPTPPTPVNLTGSVIN